MWKRTHNDRTRGLLLTGLKAAGSAAVAIAVASAIHLQFSATAGIIAILSLMGTKRETMKVALGRLMAYGAALLIAFVCFSLFGDGLLAFGIYLFVFASLCYACSWGYATAVISAVETLAKNCSANTRGTVGYISVLPCEHNIIAEKATISVDFREVEDAKWEKLYTDLMEVTRRECEKRQVEWSVESTCDLRPAHCAPELVHILEEAATGSGYEKERMISFPAHDAMNMSRIMPMGMLFLRSSNGGLSHCPEEYTTQEDLTLGTQVLANALYLASNREFQK